MIGLLSATGRAIIVIAAVLTVIGFTAEGYLIARFQEALSYGNFSISRGGQIMPLELLYLAIGSGAGFIAAGTVFGTVATLYEIRDSLRLLTKLSPDGSF
jgi:hypothetical protein